MSRAWVETAIRMRAEGALIREICAIVERGPTVVGEVLNPEMGARRHAAAVQRQRERYAADPKYRAKRLAKRKRTSIRQAAKQEAAETGELVEAVFQRWGVA